MKKNELAFRSGFRLSIGNSRSQAAVTVLAADGREGGPTTFTRVPTCG
jgi:hypothetical protein